MKIPSAWLTLFSIEESGAVDQQWGWLTNEFHLRYGIEIPRREIVLGIKESNVLFFDSKLSNRRLTIRKPDTWAGVANFSFDFDVLEPFPTMPAPVSDRDIIFFWDCLGLRIFTTIMWFESREEKRVLGRRVKRTNSVCSGRVIDAYLLNRVGKNRPSGSELRKARDIVGSVISLEEIYQADWESRDNLLDDVELRLRRSLSPEEFELLQGIVSG